MAAPPDDVAPVTDGGWTKHPTLGIDLSNTIEAPSISGIQRVALGLTEALSNHVPVAVLDGRQGALAPAGRLARARLRRLQGGHSGTNLLGRLESRLRRLGAGRHRSDHFDDRLDAGDVLIDIEPSWHAPQRRDELLPRLADRSILTAAVLHDVLPLTDPDWFPPESVERFTRWFEAHVAADSVFIAVSAATADLTASRIGRRPAVMRMGTTPPSGNDRGPTTGGRPSTGSGLLMLGTIEPRKGHQVILDALDRLGADAPTVDVVGRAGWGDPSVLRRLADHPRVRWHRHAADEQVADLWETTGLLLQPSLGEGYGLPVVEALQRGVAVAAADLPVLREVTRGHATFVPHDPAAWAEALSRFAADPSAWPRPEPLSWPSWDGSADDVLSALRTAGRWPDPDPGSR